MRVDSGLVKAIKLCHVQFFRPADQTARIILQD